MNWWQIALLAFSTYMLGIINATVAERDRYSIWMANSWELIKRRGWWVGLLKKNEPDDTPTLEDIAELTANMIQTVNDYYGVFSRPYIKEPLLEPEQEVSDGTE